MKTKNNYFTVEEANKSLVLVRPIIEDIVVKRKKMIELKKDLKVLESTNNLLRISEIKQEIINTSKEITYHLEELEEVGCHLKDFELGLVDFPSVLNGKVIFLSYMLGEEGISHYHNLTNNEMNIIKK